MEAWRNFPYWAFNRMNEEDLKPPGRLAWLRFEGLPIYVRRSKVVQEMAEMFGNTLEVDGILDDNIQLNVARAFILTHRIENINQVFTAKIDSKVVKIRVMEELLCPIVIDHKSTSEYDADIVMDSDVRTGGAHGTTNIDNVEVHDRETDHTLHMAQNSNIGNQFSDDFGKCKDGGNTSQWGTYGPSFQNDIRPASSGPQANVSKNPTLNFEPNFNDNFVPASFENSGAELSDNEVNKPNNIPH
nr:hypothetical protein [Tanacetum cinerariifolium]GEV75618.1 hypothetical protein [Tanacetum cinerariifolium]GEV79899.1 hypothetical protein [Tanacetum cinerariifolium]GEV97157.1 hypothetical protein [Tanacetum cinerariifolium]GEW09231.1 hypothetical protein [Tanacetum cinerariifolium]